MELEALQEAVGDIRSLGAELVLISPQQIVFNRDLVREKQLTFELLSDAGNRAGRAYGLVYTVPENIRKIYLQFGIDVAKHNADGSWDLPMPARFIIDRQGTIRYAAVDPDYTVRPEPEETIAALKALGS